MSDVRATNTRASTPGIGRVALGGVLGGLVGTAAFGALSAALDLGFVRSFVPALFGLEQQGAVGWAIHLAAGAALGLAFALIVSRDAVREFLVPDPEEPVLGPLNLEARLVAAGFTYGLAVWALLPMLVLPIWLGAVGTEGVSEIPGTATESLAAHAVFGALLGVVYALVERQ